MPLDVSRAPASASPLWIIALFIALSEATAGVAAITTDGIARLIFSCFAVAFPTLVFGVFVWLLVKHAPKLYAPGQYSRDITPEIYRLGVSRADSIFLGRAVAETVVPLLGDDSGADSREAAVEKIVRRFEAVVDESSITVSLRPLKPQADLLQLPVSSATRIQPLLNEIFFALDPVVDPMSYDRSWVLISEEGEEYSDMGMAWAEQHGLGVDSRTIEEVGILPGSNLTAVRKAEPRRRRTAVKSKAGEQAERSVRTKA
jgi:hypothetical protein